MRLASVVLIVGLVVQCWGEEVPTEKPGSEKLVARVLNNCAEMGCVKVEVLHYLDSLLKIDSKSTSAREMKNIDQAIFKRAARLLNTNEFQIKLPEMIFGPTSMVYNPKSGLDIASSNTNDDQSRGLLKKKLFLPILLLLKLKMKALMPIFVLIAKIKAVKALILSKLALGVVIGFIIYQMMNKAGMPMPMSMTMAPLEPPGPPPPNMYGPPSMPPTTSPPSSYEPSWEPSGGSGPYSRVWTGSSLSSSSGGSLSGSSAESNPQNIAYSAYYPGSSALGSTQRP